MENNNTYFTIHSFMVTDLKLSGNDLLVYALILNFTLKGSDSCFNGSLAYLQSALNISKNTAINVLKKLTSDGLILKKEVNKRGMILNEYTCAKIEPVQKLNQSKNCDEVYQNLDLGVPKIAPNNNIDNNINNNKEIKDENKFSLSFSEEFKKYLIELENFPLCKKIEIQLTDKNLTEILKDFEFEQIIEALEIIENSRNVKLRKNLNLTMRNILKNNFGGGKEFQRDLKAFKQVYIDWYYKDNNSKPKISKNDNYAAIELFKHLKENSKTGDNEGAIKSLRSIFENWDKIEPFYKKKVELHQISNNINIIINQIKNGYGQQKSAGNNEYRGQSIQEIARNASARKDHINPF